MKKKKEKSIIKLVVVKTSYIYFKVIALNHVQFTIERLYITH
jgi:hypothetical protein